MLYLHFSFGYFPQEVQDDQPDLIDHRDSEESIQTDHEESIQTDQIDHRETDHHKVFVHQTVRSLELDNNEPVEALEDTSEPADIEWMTEHQTVQQVSSEPGQTFEPDENGTIRILESATTEPVDALEATSNPADIEWMTEHQTTEHQTTEHLLPTEHQTTEHLLPSRPRSRPELMFPSRPRSQLEPFDYQNFFPKVHAFFSDYTFLEEEDTFPEPKLLSEVEEEEKLRAAEKKRILKAALLFSGPSAIVLTVAVMALVWYLKKTRRPDIGRHDTGLDLELTYQHNPFLGQRAPPPTPNASQLLSEDESSLFSDYDEEDESVLGSIRNIFEDRWMETQSNPVTDL